MESTSSDEGFGGLRRLFREHPVVAAGVGLLVVIGTLLIWRLISGGDEAPIRVRNGSIDLILQNTTTQVWKKTGNHWTISAGTRNHDDYTLKLSAASGACKNTSQRKRTVKLYSSDNHWIELRATGRHTNVTSDVSLSISSDGLTLSYTPKDVYVMTIELDGELSCAFKSSAELTWLDLQD